MMTKHEPLEELENLVKNHFGDLLVSVAVSARGTLFLSIWQQPSQNVGAYYMSYLPLFYIVCAVDEGSKLSLKLITFHGKVLDELNEKERDVLTEEDKISFVSKITRVQLCQGVNALDNELKLDPQTFAFLYLIEHLEKDVIIRSRQCKFGLVDGSNVCNACEALNKEHTATRGNASTDFLEYPSSVNKRGRGRPKLHHVKIENGLNDLTKRGRVRPKDRLDYNEHLGLFDNDGFYEPSALSNEDVKPYMLKNVKVCRN